MADAPAPSSTTDTQLIEGSIPNELSASRTAMSFERTGMSSDRTLMSVIRTSLSLIAFGFTIFQFFHTLSTQFVKGGLPAAAPRRFGLALVVLGVLLLTLGIVDHWRTMRRLKARRQRLFELGIMHHAMSAGFSSAMYAALLLLTVGILAIARILFRQGPF